MLRTLLRSSMSSILVAAAYIAVASPSNAIAQEQPVTFNISLTYNTHFENVSPTPLVVQPSSVCTLRGPSIQVFYDAPHDQVNYYSTATVRTYFFFSKNGVSVDCAFTFFGTGSGLYVGDLFFSPSSEQIFASFVPVTSAPPILYPAMEIAYLLYVDISNPGHAIYHFRGNDALFALAQQTLGVNFTGVELTFDVQAPSS